MRLSQSIYSLLAGTSIDPCPGSQGSPYHGPKKAKGSEICKPDLTNRACKELKNRIIEQSRRFFAVTVKTIYSSATVSSRRDQAAESGRCNDFDL